MRGTGHVPDGVGPLEMVFPSAEEDFQALLPSQYWETHSWRPVHSSDCCWWTLLHHAWWNTVKFGTFAYCFTSCKTDKCCMINKGHLRKINKAPKC